jgi:cytidylate kinase
MTLVTVAASYGAGGSRVAPELARRLGVPFLGRRSDHAAGAGLEADAAGAGVGGGRLLSRCASVAVAWGTPPGLTAEEPRRRELEREVRAFAQAGRGVILGRGAAVVLRSDPRALHVLLDGPRSVRVTQAMAIEGIDRETAERRLSHTDRFRRAYLEDLYGVDLAAPGVFHLALDSTAITLADCVEIIADAAQRRAQAIPQ